MKTKIWIAFRAENIPGEAATILVPTDCGPDVAEVEVYSAFGPRSVEVDLKLDETDERVPKVLALLQQYGVEVKSFHYTEYSEEDRQQARLLWVRVDPAYLVGGGPGEGTKYDLTNACSHCKTGAKQKSVLYVDQDAQKLIRKHRVVISTSDRSILVDGGMRKKLVDAGITGISFGDVRARHENKKWSAVARDQILIEHVMPPMRGELSARDEQYLCKVCRRGGRISSPEMPYREEDLVGMQDFNHTWEWFGEFHTPDYKFGPCRSHPLMLVTPKVMNIFNKAGVKAFDWIPVNVAP